MAASAKHRGWITKPGAGVLAAVYNGAMPGTAALGANTALDGVLAGTPVSAASPVDTIVISNTVSNGDILLATLLGGTNSTEIFRIDTSAGLVVFNEASADLDFRVETDGIAFAIYADGGKNALVLGSNTDSSSADQLITVSRAARTATASTNYYDFVIAPAGAVTVPAGTTAVVASAAFNEPNITTSATVTDACTVYIVAAPTEGGANYALLIAAGTAALKGGAYFGATVTTSALVSQTTSGSGSTTYYIGNSTINVTSDMRVKTDIREWRGNALDLLRQAEPLKQFRYNLPGGGPQDTGYGPNARGTYLGFMAQETRKWAPWVVNAGDGAGCLSCEAGLPCDKHTPWTVEYQHLLPIVVTGLKELDARLSRAGF